MPPNFEMEIKLNFAASKAYIDLFICIHFFPTNIEIHSFKTTSHHFIVHNYFRKGFLDGLDGKESAYIVGGPLEHSCLENPMDRGAWRAKVHGVAKSQKLLSN